MKQYFFIGDTEGNTGPSNVNKGITANLTERFSYLHSRNTIMKMLEAVCKALFCRVVIVSSVSRCGAYIMYISKLFCKKAIYIMHGCTELEAVLNDFQVDKKVILYEKKIIKSADLILPVSHKFSLFIQEYYPQYKDKFKYLDNGVERAIAYDENIERVKGTVIAVGGDRKVKNNITVARAMRKVKTDSKLTVYGHLYHPNDLPEDEKIEFKGLVSQDQLYKEMMASELYILNSTYEPFALSIFDALFCGCSILISRAAGALEVLEVMDCDVIDDPMNEEEIAEKISYLLQNPNNSRIVKSLDWEALSYQTEVKKLEKFCDDLTLT